MKRLFKILSVIFGTTAAGSFVLATGALNVPIFLILMSVFFVSVFLAYILGLAAERQEDKLNTDKYIERRGNDGIL